MNNTLKDLNNYLFGQLDRLNNDKLSSEENFEREMKRTKAITEVSKTIIDNAGVILEAKKYADEMGLTQPEIFEMLEYKRNAK